MFASVATQKALKDHQAVTTTGNQARAVQGRSKSGKATAAPPAEELVTHATIIRYGGLPDAEAERALHAKPPHFLVQAAQRALDRLSRQAPRILHGSWSLNYDQTCNFSLVLSGLIPACELLKYKTQLCEPFIGAETDLVPARGWSWAQLRNVPTIDEEGLVWSPKDLFQTFIANPCFADTLICAPPHWQGNPVFSGKAASTVFVAYIDEGNLISQRASKEGVYMFGQQVTFIHCGDSPTLVVTDLQGPPSERTPEEKLWDFKTRAQQYARDRRSCDDVRISYLEFLETEAEDDLALARMIAG
jgi:hypothetical protein